jgi:hypothetical protein
MTKKEKIISKAIEILKNNPDGVRYSELVRKIKQEFSDIPVNTIYGVIWNLDSQIPDKIYKPVRGLFRHIDFREKEGIEMTKTIKSKGFIKKWREEDFYQPFADWLENEAEECTKAIPLGKNKFKDKWGTPDVIGIYESRASDIIKLPTEVISAEIKIDTKDLITAFGQACAYKLFSNKSYIVVPKDSPQKEIGKLEALCKIFGIGLVVFNNKDPKFPEFEIRVTPIKHEPDRFFTNQYLKLIEDELF